MHQPKFKHDCTNCKFLGHAKDQDWYSCKNEMLGSRSIIARFGDDGIEYKSCSLFRCAELTSLERLALSLGLEITPEEERKMLKILLHQEKQKIGIGAVPGDELIGCSDYFEWRANDV